ncbi:MAG: nitroreductase family deazaflavin-dependent oxidoreductase [Kineosporiaceae bacterium]|nr:nitroreductase family deazaflavin-dependent oxidoreductase [Kineosporiaceae bacterium]
MSWNDAVIEQFLRGEQRIANTFDRDFLILLDTIGAKSGLRRTSPVGCFADGDRLLIVASKAGADTHPAWYANLVAHPTVGVRRWENDELAEYQATAVVLDGAERDRVFEWIVQQAPGFGTYQTRTDRVIPVVALHPRRQTTPPRAGPLSPTPGDPS